jgi:hypothetical protein
MGALATIIIAASIIALIWGVFQKVKAGRVMDAPLVRTGDAGQRGPEVANAKGALSTQGNVLCQQPLVSPMTGTQCLYYSLKVTASWKEGDATKTKELQHHKMAAQFAIDDGSGAVWVDATEGGDFEPSKSNEVTQGTGIIGGITGQELVFGNFRVQTGMLALGTKYTVREEVLPLVPRLYACGKSVNGSIAAPGFRSLILSNKSRDELLASAAKGSKYSFIGGGVAFALGGILAVLSAVFGGGSEKAGSTRITSAELSVTGERSGACNLIDKTGTCTEYKAASTGDSKVCEVLGGAYATGACPGGSELVATCEMSTSTKRYYHSNNVALSQDESSARTDCELSEGKLTVNGAGSKAGEKAAAEKTGADKPAPAPLTPVVKAAPVVAVKTTIAPSKPQPATAKSAPKTPAPAGSSSASKK